MFVHTAEIGLRFYAPGFSGFLIPEKGLSVVLLDSRAVFVHDAQFAQRFGISCFDSFENSLAAALCFSPAFFLKTLQCRQDIYAFSFAEVLVAVLLFFIALFLLGMLQSALL